MKRVKNAILPLLLFLVPMAFYLSTMLPTVGFQDAGYYLAAVKVGGVSYPTGYPLYMILAGLFSILPLALSFTIKVHLLASVASCGAALLTYYTLSYIFRNELNRSRFLKQALFFGFSLLLVTGKSVWAQSINAEVYTLQLFLVALFWFYFVRFLEEGKGLYGATFALSLMLCNHMTGIVSLTFFIIFLVVKRAGVSRAKYLRIILIAVGTGTLLYSYLPIRSLALSGVVDNPLLNWGLTEEPSNFIRHILGLHWSIAEASYSLNPGEVVGNIIHGFQIIYQNYYLPLFLFFLWGLWKLIRSSHILKRPLLGYFCLHLVFNSIFTQSTELANYYFPIFFVVVLVSVFGLVAILKVIGNDRFRSIAVAVVLALVVAPVALINLREIDRSDCYIFRELGDELIRSPEKDAVLLLAGDVPLCAVSYIQEVAGKRQDLLVLSHPMFSRFKWYRDQMVGRIDFEESGVMYPDKYVKQLLEKNRQRSFYISGLEYFESSFFAEYTVVPAGYLYKIVPRGYPLVLPDGVWEIKAGNGVGLQQVTATSKAELDNLVNIKKNAVKFRINLLTAVDLTGEPERVTEIIRLCTSIEESMPAWRGRQPQGQAGERVRQAVFRGAIDEHLRGNSAGALRLMRNLLAVDPDDADAHLYSGNILFDTGKRALASGHYQRLLALNPEHPMRVEIERRVAAD